MIDTSKNHPLNRTIGDPKNARHRTTQHRHRHRHSTPSTHLGADVVLGGGLREALNVHGVLRDGRHAAPAALAPLIAVLAAVLSSLATASSCAAPPVAVAAPAAAAAAVGLAAVLVALAGGADAGDRCPLLELKLSVGVGGVGGMGDEWVRKGEQTCVAGVFIAGCWVCIFEYVAERAQECGKVATPTNER